MTLFLRATQMIVQHGLKSKLHTISEPISNNFRVLPIDIDVYRHMNNAKYLNYMESSRWGLMTRCGLLKTAIKNKWTAPIRSIDIEYYRPLKLWQHFELQTQFVGFDEKWFYMTQRFFSEKKEMARAFVRGTVRRGRTNVPPSEYLATFVGIEPDLSIPDDLEEWVRGKWRAEHSQW